MPEFKIVISEKGKSYSRNLNSEESEVFLNKKMKDKIEGGHLGFKGYEFEITGGSDKEGFPIREDVEGLVRKRIFITKGKVGARIKKKGIRIRKSVANNLISQNTSQINLKVIKTGSKLLDEIFGKTLKEAPQEEVKKEKAKE